MLVDTDNQHAVALRKRASGSQGAPLRRQHNFTKHDFVSMSLRANSFHASLCPADQQIYTTAYHGDPKPCFHKCLLREECFCPGDQ